MELYPLILQLPLDPDLMFTRDGYLKFTPKRGMRIPEPYQLHQLPYQRTPQRDLNLPCHAIMTIDVASYSGPAQEVHVVRLAQKANVIYLWNPRREKLKSTGNQVIGFLAAQSIQESAVYLV
jgi:hypothetical protein